MKHRVQKLLSNYGFCSRREAEELIKNGHVKINGKIIKIGQKANETDTITVYNRIVSSGNKKIYIAMNKPVGIICAVKDDKAKTIIDILPYRDRIFPVGRLDKNTSGLIFLTNDGDFANKIMHPRNEVKKTYEASLNKELEEIDIKKLRSGVKLKNFTTRPAGIQLLPPEKVEIEIHEGKNRIIRKMFSKLGYDVIRLHRTKIGNIKLDGIKPGQSKVLDWKDTKNAVRSVIGNIAS